MADVYLLISSTAGPCVRHSQLHCESRNWCAPKPCASRVHGCTGSLFPIGRAKKKHIFLNTKAIDVHSIILKLFSRTLGAWKFKLGTTSSRPRATPYWGWYPTVSTPPPIQQQHVSYVFLISCISHKWLEIDKLIQHFPSKLAVFHQIPIHYLRPLMISHYIAVNIVAWGYNIL